MNYVIGQAFCAYIQIFVSTGYLIENSSLSMLPFWERVSPVMCYVHIIISTYYFNIMGCYQILYLWVVFILSYVCQDYSICQIKLQNYHARMGARKLVAARPGQGQQWAAPAGIAQDSEKRRIYCTGAPLQPLEWRHRRRPDWDWDPDPTRPGAIDYRYTPTDTATACPLPWLDGRGWREYLLRASSGWGPIE
jgi:hypothetical protein